MSTFQRAGLSGDFNENSPRPPVPGEETGAGSVSPVAGYPHISSWSSFHHKGTALKRSDSPVLTPRRSSLAAGSHHRSTVEGHHAPLGFEPEGRCGGGDGSGRYPHEQPSPPPYLRWAQNLHFLLEDSDGVQLFRSYLEQEGPPHADTLDFWFACRGLKKQSDEGLISHLVKLIYKKYFSQLAISEELKKDVNRKIKEREKDKRGFSSSVFDDAQSAVECLIERTTYPNFLKSDLYLQHVQSMQNGPSGSGESSSSSGGTSSRDPVGLTGGSFLPTLHEDAELSFPPGPVIAAHGGVSGPMRLTHDLLMATERKRAMDVKPKPEAYAGIYLQRPYHSPYLTHPNNYLAYNSYNPVSRQDSELQSLSSDARTESDNMSLTDSSVDGKSSVGRSWSSRRLHQRLCKQMKESASLNRDPHLHRTVIPRTQLLQKEQTHSLQPEKFAEILIKKLECLKREQEAQDKLDRKLQENERCDDTTNNEPATLSENAVSSKALAEALRERLMDEDDQAILDKHVSRVWSDLTPSRSPGLSTLSTPRLKSPEGRRKAQTAQSTFLPYPYQARSGYSKHLRKEKDVVSTFSSDSGNVRDYKEGEHKHHYTEGEHKHHVPKSKSVPDYELLMQQDHGSHDSRFQQAREASRRSTCRRKTLTDQADSGVSVVSDTPPVMPPQTNSKVLSWLLDSEKLAGGSGGGEGSWTRSERESSSSSKHRVRASSATSPITARHSRKSGLGQGHHAQAQGGSRSGSLERGGERGTCLSGLAATPAQPFIADPSMPPLPQPNTATQLEEARRRLRHLGPKGESSHSNPSTLRRTRPPSRPVNDQDFTVVVFTFCDEQFPYRTRIQGRPITLKQFKDVLPKKGSYRYFFKTECEDVDTRVIQEEITDDNDIIPLWEGKIMAQVKSVEQ